MGPLNGGFLGGGFLEGGFPSRGFPDGGILDRGFLIGGFPPPENGMLEAMVSLVSGCASDFDYEGSKSEDSERLSDDCVVC